MTTYVYETIPNDEKTEPKLFEIQQNMEEPALTKHPETGEPIRRVILGGYGTLNKSDRAAEEDCGPGCCCG